MRFALDTERYEDIKVEITETDSQEGSVEVIQAFCFAMAAFFTDFAMKIGCDTEKAASLKTLVL